MYKNLLTYTHGITATPASIILTGPSATALITNITCDSTSFSRIRYIIISQWTTNYSITRID